MSKNGCTRIIKQAVLVVLITISSSSAFAGKIFFCSSTQDYGGVFDEADLNCKDARGRDFTVTLWGAGPVLRAAASVTTIICPFLPKDKVKELNASGIRIELVPLIGGRIAFYRDKNFVGCMAIGIEAGLGAGIVFDSLEIKPGKRTVIEN